MGWVILAAVAAVPLLEIATFFQVAHWLGLLPAIALGVLATLAGVALVRGQGLATAWRARDVLEQGQPPVAEIFDGICLAFAGFLLLLPGFLSDLLALPLLLPPVRAALRHWLGRHATVVGTGSRSAPPGTTIIEAEFEIIDPAAPGPSAPGCAKADSVLPRTSAEQGQTFRKTVDE